MDNKRCRTHVGRGPSWIGIGVEELPRRIEVHLAHPFDVNNRVSIPLECLHGFITAHSAQKVVLPHLTALQLAEGLSDRAAADVVRSRIDWKYLLCLELEDPGFDFCVLCEFRARLLESEAERRLFDKLLEVARDRKLVKARGRQRTDSTHVLAAIRAINRLEAVVETLRCALNVLATVAPEWVLEHIPVEWVDRYERRADDYRLPESETRREAYAEGVGTDGCALLNALWSEASPAWPRQVPAVETLRKVWVQDFTIVEGKARWRGSGNIPPSSI